MPACSPGKDRVKGYGLFPDPIGHFGLSRWWGVAVDVALQAVSECPSHRYAGIIIKDHTTILSNLKEVPNATPSQYKLCWHIFFYFQLNYQSFWNGALIDSFLIAFKRLVSCLIMDFSFVWMCSLHLRLWWIWQPSNFCVSDGKMVCTPACSVTSHLAESIFCHCSTVFVVIILFIYCFCLCF